MLQVFNHLRNMIILTYFNRVRHTPPHFTDSMDSGYAPETCLFFFLIFFRKPSLPNISQVEQIVTLRRGRQQVIQGLTYIAGSESGP